MPDNLLEVESLGNLELVAARVVEGFITGLHQSPFHGFSSEFNEHRLYNKGESTRHIDWKLFARTENLFVKRYEDETNLRCQIVLDVSASMKYPQNQKPSSKLEFSVVCAAAILNLLRKQRDAAGLTIFSNGILFSSDAKVSPVHSRMLFSQLEKFAVDKSIKKVESDIAKISIAETLHTVAENIHKRSLVIIFSDMFDSGKSEDLFAALGHLRHCGHDVILFHVFDRNTEQNFNFDNRPYKFVDMETGEETAINPLEIKDNYRKSAKKFREDLKTRCTMLNMDFAEADICDDFKSVLVPYLLKRSRLH